MFQSRDERGKFCAFHRHVLVDDNMRCTSRGALHAMSVGWMYAVSSSMKLGCSRFISCRK